MSKAACVINKVGDVEERPVAPDHALLSSGHLKDSHCPHGLDKRAQEKMVTSAWSLLKSTSRSLTDCRL